MTNDTDITLAYFLATREPSRVRLERPTESVRAFLTRDYDRQTEEALMLIRAQRMTTAVQAAGKS